MFFGFMKLNCKGEPVKAETETPWKLQKKCRNSAKRKRKARLVPIYFGR